MEITLTPELEHFVAQKVQHGDFATASEAVVYALQRYEEGEREAAQDLAVLREEIDERVRSLDRGEFVQPDVLWAEFDRRSDERRKHAA